MSRAIDNMIIRDIGISMAEDLKNDPASIDQIISDELFDKSRFLQRTFEYAKAVNRNDDIKKWCREENIRELDVFLSKLKEEKPELYAQFRKSVGSLQVFLRYFANLKKEDILKEKREQARGGKPASRKAKAVICTDNNMEFKSINKAAEWLGHKRTHDISDCCYGIISNVKGYHFRFKNEEQ